MNIIIETLITVAILAIFLFGVVLIADFIIGNNPATGSKIEY